MLGACVASAQADIMENARQLVNEGDYWKASQLLKEAVAANPKVAQTAQYNYLAGACEFESGNYAEAKTLLQAARGKGSGPANLYLGRLSFLDYDFDTAADFYGEFKRHREKSRQVVGETVEELERQLMIAENSLGRVENITVIDSIAVPFENFFKAYRLPRSAGRLLTPDEMPIEEHSSGAVMAFVNEGGYFMMWGEPDSVGNVRLMESLRLTDGVWQEPSATSDILGKGRYNDYPFMMPDGVTLYYASDGDESMGGYDIFVATRDASTGEYLLPQNIGMPFNSPHDDFMLAIDEENGVGWWATDRNLLGDKITIYVYVVNELRRNYDPDDETLLAKARLTDYRSTQNPADRDKYEGLLSAISKIGEEKPAKKEEFSFPMGNGVRYTAYSDFKNAKAREAMNDYVRAVNARIGTRKKLKGLRERYRVNHADNVKDEILQLERQEEKQNGEIAGFRSEVYRLEKGKR